MGLHKDEGDPALALAEECAEVIQVITKAIRFGGNWNECRPGKTKTRMQELDDEMVDLIYQYQRFKKEQGLE